MKQILFLIGRALAVAGVARGADADGCVLLDGREWRLSPECRLEGSLLTVPVPKDKARGLHAAVTMVDLTPFASSGFEATIRVRGKGVTVPPKPYNGVKFMFHFRPLGGSADKWPGATLPTGSFDWGRAAVGCAAFRGAEGGKGRLVLGLQDSSGTVTFDLSTLSIAVPRPLGPITNQNHVAIYTPDVAARPRMRGVMSPAWSTNPRTERPSVRPLTTRANVHCWRGSSAECRFGGRATGKMPQYGIIARFKRSVWS